ncbi:protein of unknown function [Ligilactobacillus sp. WC1T17]|uniref:DUF1836 domain-containing protein n=1 Tax=Ligilactobacillus ruminis TaxID=1623 RepID=A0ABY1ADY2_9LACO|nr:protein of unknown function [Ligilactobacillus ruminis]
MEENFDLKLWLSNLDDHHLPLWNEFPEFDLYMEQLVGLGNAYLANFSDNRLTASMINSYVKKGLISRPIKKKYRSEHIAELIVVSLLKTIYPLDTIKSCIKTVIKHSPTVKDAYNNFANLFNESLQMLYHNCDTIQLTQPQDNTAYINAAEKLAVRAVIYKFVGQKIISQTITAQA